MPALTLPQPLTGRFFRAAFIVALVVMGSLSGGCATRPPASDHYAVAEFERINDPAEPFNRKVHRVNQIADQAIVEPIAVLYGFAIPKPLRQIITNVLRNLQEPLTLVHDILQGEGDRAATTLGRFASNSTIGLGGSFDVATGFGLERHTEDFGQTLAVWGIGEGPYLVLPFLGPSGLRDGVGRLGDFYMDPVSIARSEANVNGLSLIHMGVGAIDVRHRNLDNLRELEASAIDLYATMRSAYRQNRRKEIRNGAPLEDEEDFDVFDDFEDFSEDDE